MKKAVSLILAGMMTVSAAATVSAADAHDYDLSDQYVAADEAAVYEGEEPWPELTWNYDCSTGETSTWAQAGYYFAALMNESTVSLVINMPCMIRYMIRKFFPSR